MNAFTYNEWSNSQVTLKLGTFICMYKCCPHYGRQIDGDDTHIADLLAALDNLVIRGFQHCGVLRLGTFILLSVLPLQEVMDKKL